MKVGVADFGMNVWYGGLFDLERRLSDLKAIGYDGIERVEAATEDELVYKVDRFRKAGMSFGTVRAANVELSIRWAASVGAEYIWSMVNGRDFDTFCRQLNYQAEASERWGVHTVVHNHLGSLVESQEQVEEYLKRCPGAYLLMDTAHLAAAGGNPLAIVEGYADRIISLHVKDWLAERSPAAEENWTKRGRFCELGAGNIGLDNAAVIDAMRQSGYDGWVFVEQDTHLQDPLKDLAISREYLRKAGV